MVQHAALHCGACVVGLDPNYPASVLDRLIETCGLAGLFVYDREQAKRLASEFPSSFVIGLDQCLDAGKSPVSRATGGPADEDLMGPDPDDPAIIVFSSGTTNDPKPIQYYIVKFCLP
ncbi:MAG: AMP-binding protein [Betaproteobacteria bacterium]|nr:AMP-binding protein [Betaproteobacteria bacterium]